MVFLVRYIGPEKRPGQITLSSLWRFGRLQQDRVESRLPFCPPDLTRRNDLSPELRSYNQLSEDREPEYRGRRGRLCTRRVRKDVKICR